MNTDQLKNLREAIDAKLNGKPWQLRPLRGSLGSPYWTDATEGMEIDSLEVFEYRAKPEAVTRDWFGLGDVPSPGPCYLRSRGSYGWALIVAAGTDCIVTYGFPELVKLKWEHLKAYEYSTDLKTWLPCKVTEEQP